MLLGRGIALKDKVREGKTDVTDYERWLQPHYIRLVVKCVYGCF